MKLARIATIFLALFTGVLAGCQTDGTGGASGTTSSSGSSGGY